MSRIILSSAKPPFREIGTIMPLRKLLVPESCLSETGEVLSPSMKVNERQNLTLQDPWEDEWDDDFWGEEDDEEVFLDVSSDPVADVNQTVESLQYDIDNEKLVKAHPFQVEIERICKQIKDNQYSELTPHPFVKDIVLTWFQHDFLTAADLYFKRSILGRSCGPGLIHLNNDISVDSYRFDEKENSSFCVFEHENVTLSEIINQWPIQPFRIVLSWFFDDYQKNELLPFDSIAKNIKRISDALDALNEKQKENHITELLKRLDVNTLKEIRNVTKKLGYTIADHRRFNATSVFRVNKTLDGIIQSKGLFSKTKRNLLNIFSRPTDNLLKFGSPS